MHTGLKFNCTQEETYVPLAATNKTTVWQMLMYEEPPELDKSLCYINAEESEWGDREDCEHLIYMPLVGAISAAMWFVMFVMCGHGGKGQES